MKELRLSKDLSQQQVANAIGLEDYKSISKYENGKQWPEPEIIDRLAVYFNVPINYLFTDIESTDLNRLISDILDIVKKYQNISSK